MLTLYSLVPSAQADMTAYPMCIKTPVDMHPNLARSARLQPSSKRLQFGHTCHAALCKTWGGKAHINLQTLLTHFFTFSSPSPEKILLNISMSKSFFILLNSQSTNKIMKIRCQYF